MRIPAGRLFAWFQRSRRSASRLCWVLFLLLLQAEELVSAGQRQGNYE